MATVKKKARGEDYHMQCRWAGRVWGVHPGVPPQRAQSGGVIWRRDGGRLGSRVFWTWGIPDCAWERFFRPTAACV